MSGFSTDPVRIPIVVDDTPIAPGLAGLNAKMRELRDSVKETTQPFDDFKKITTGLGHVMFPFTLAIGAGVAAFAALASKSADVRDQADRLSESWGRVTDNLAQSEMVGGKAAVMLGLLSDALNAINPDSGAQYAVVVAGIEKERKALEDVNLTTHARGLHEAQLNYLLRRKTELINENSDAAKRAADLDAKQISTLRDKYTQYMDTTAFALLDRGNKAKASYEKETKALKDELDKRVISQKEYDDGMALAGRKLETEKAAIAKEAEDKRVKLHEKAIADRDRLNTSLLKMEEDASKEAHGNYKRYMDSTSLALMDREGKAKESYRRETEALRAELDVRKGITVDKYNAGVLLAERKLSFEKAAIAKEAEEKEKDAAEKRKTNLQKYAEETKDTYRQIDTATLSAMRGMEDAFVSAARTGKLEFTAFADSVINDLLRIQIRQAIVGPLASAMGGYFGGGGAEPSSIGGSSMTLAEQQTAYGGGSLQSSKSKAAGVQAAGGGNVVINVTNNGAAPVQAKSGGVQFDGKAWIVNVVVENIEQGGGIRGAIKGVR